MFPIPRSIYYFQCRKAIKTYFNLFSLKRDNTQFGKEFANFIGANEILLTSHARVALWIILNSLQLESGSEVIMSPVNLPDMVNMILLNKLKPRFVDFKKRSTDIDITDLSSKLSSKSKVLFLTVLNGLSFNLDEILSFAKKNNLIVILDMTQSMGMEAKEGKVASLVDYCIYSLCDLKDVHTHRGGVIAFNNPDLKSSLKHSLKNIESVPDKKYFFNFVTEDLLSTLLLKRFFFNIFIYPMVRILLKLNLIDALEDLTKGKGIKFFNINIGRGLWGGDGDLVRETLPSYLTYYFTDVQGRIGLDQLKQVERIQKKRTENARHLLKSVKNKKMIFFNEEDSLFWKFPIWCDEREKLKKFLINNGVDCAPSNLPLLSEMEIFKKYHSDLTPNAKDYTESTLNLPAHYYLSPEEIAEMAEILNSFE